MPGSTSPSFIPKRNPTQKSGSAGSRQIFIGGLLVKVGFFAVVLASGGVAVYDWQLKKNLDAAVLSLNEEMAKFNQEDMDRVVAMDSRLKKAEERMKNSVSVSAVLKAVEQSTVSSNQISELGLERLNDKVLSVTAEMKSDSFDSVMFQNAIFKESENLGIIGIEDFNFTNSEVEEEFILNAGTNKDDSEIELTFNALLSVTAEKYPHTLHSDGFDLSEPDAFGTIEADSALYGGSTDSGGTVNQNDI
jgi:hypothetical protein